MDIKIYLTIFFLMLGTLLLRASFIFAASSLQQNKLPMHLLKYVPAAVFPFFIFPPVIYHQGTSELFLGKERIVALIVAFVIYMISKNTSMTLFIGLLILYFI